MWQVNEIFRSIQGEGTRTGRPSTFIRFAGCNLRCQWCVEKKGPGGRITSAYISCDTPHSQTPESAVRAGMDSGSLHAWIASVLKTNDDVILTGGEPTIQSIDTLDRHDGLNDVLRLHHVTLETNGTTAMKLPWMALLSVSPKITTYGCDEMKSAMWAAELAEMISMNPQAQTQIKFVMGNMDDLTAIKRFLSDLYSHAAYADFSDVELMIMPVSINPNYYDLLSREIIDQVILADTGLNVRLCDRLHYRLWKGERAK